MNDIDDTENDDRISTTTTTTTSTTTNAINTGSDRTISAPSALSPIADQDQPLMGSDACDHSTESAGRRSLYIPLLSPMWTNTIFSTIYTLSDTRKRLASFFIGLSTIFIVVFVVSLLYNSVLKSNVIFMKVAEDNVGDMDVVMMAKMTNTSTTPFLNQTHVSHMLQDNDMLTGVAPRWTFFGHIENRDKPEKNISAVFMVFDSELEEQYGIGRQWTHRQLGEAECLVRDVLLRAVDIKPNRGQRINVRLDFQSVLGAIAGQDQIMSQGSTSAPSLPDTEIVQQMFRTFLTDQLGISPQSQFAINVTELAQQQSSNIPPALAPFLDQVGVVIITGDQVLDALIGTNNTTNDNGFLDTIMSNIGGEYGVVDSVKGNMGKYPSALGNVVILDSKFLPRAIADHVLNIPEIRILLEMLGLYDRAHETLSNFPLHEYAFQLVGMYRNRFKAYLKPKKELDQEMIVLTNSIVDSIGIGYPISISLPLVGALASTEFISLFLEQIFVGVVVMLGALGAILIFSLLLANVEEKTFEYGMLRALGMKKPQLIQVILTTSTYFAIPGIIIGILMSFGLNILFEYILAYIVTLPLQYIQYTLNWISVAIPIALGLGIPLLSNIVPIRKALAKTLRDSLDVTHQTFNETTVKMIRLEKLGLEPWQTALSILLVIIGFVVYYVIPMSFIFSDLPLFFYILNAILLGMLFGLCLVAVVVQPVFERLILFVLLWGPERRLYTLIKKNLAGHRKRSRRTFLMFVLAVAFVIFAGVVFSMQATNIKANVEVLVGSDVIAQSISSNYPLPVDKLNTFMDEQVLQGYVRNYGYASFGLSRLPFVSSTRFATLAFYPSNTVNVYALSRNYLNVTYNKYFRYTSVDNSFKYQTVGGRLDIVDSLYRHAGQARVDGEVEGFVPQVVFNGRPIGVSINDTEQFDPEAKYKDYIDVIAPQAMHDESSVALNKPLQLKIYTRNPTTGQTSSQDWVCKARAMIYKMPGYFMSSYRFAAPGSPVFISEDKYLQLARNAAEQVEYTDFDNTIPREKLLMQYEDSVNQTMRSDILNGLRAVLNPDVTHIQDVRDIVSSTNTATSILIAFFNVVAVIAGILCFFILSVSFTSNVNESSWEFGVLRSVGLSVSKLIRAYIYEALCLVLSAFTCGTIIGVAIAITMVMQVCILAVSSFSIPSMRLTSFFFISFCHVQFNLFLEMGMVFEFPWPTFVVLFVMAVVVAILGSYIPARFLKQKSISQVLKGL